MSRGRESHVMRERESERERERSSTGAAAVGTAAAVAFLSTGVRRIMHACGYVRHKWFGGMGERGPALRA